MFSPELPNPTSLKKISNIHFNIDNLRNEIFNQIIFNLEHLDGVNEIYKKFLYRRGELEQFVNSSTETFFGVILDTDDVGKLLVRAENSRVLSFSNNEVKFVLR